MTHSYTQPQRLRIVVAALAALLLPVTGSFQTAVAQEDFGQPG